MLLCATDGLVGMEIPADAEPEDAAAIFAIVDEGIDRIVRRNIPSASIKHIGDESRKSQSFLHQLLADAKVTVMDGLGFKLREVLWRSDEILRLNGHPSQRHDV